MAGRGKSVSTRDKIGIGPREGSRKAGEFSACDLLFFFFSFFGQGGFAARDTHCREVWPLETMIISSIPPIDGNSGENSGMKRRGEKGRWKFQLSN
jgi:hypothetical protein